ncbi:ATP-binding protein, partial [Micromonospora globispora]
MTGYDLRPGADSFELFGARVTLVDAAGLLAAGTVGPVELLTDAAFPAPVRAARLTVRAEDGTHRFEAEIRTASGRTVGLLALGVAGPAGVLLARRLATADQSA